MLILCFSVMSINVSTGHAQDVRWLRIGELQTPINEVGAEYEEEFAFTDTDLRLLTTLANSTSVALENARLFEETNQRAAELALINSVQEGLAAELEIDDGRYNSTLTASIIITFNPNGYHGEMIVDGNTYEWDVTWSEVDGWYGYWYGGN